MRLSRGRLITIGLVVLTVLGFVFLRGPTPHIAIKAETITSAGPVNITNTMITSWFIVAFMIITVFLASRRWELVPRGAQNVLEAILEAFYGMVVNVAGEKLGRRFFPVVATIFFFVLISNWLSLLPLFNVIGFHSGRRARDRHGANEGRAHRRELGAPVRPRRPQRRHHRRGRRRCARGVRGGYARGESSW